MFLSKTIQITRSECFRCTATVDRENADPETLPDGWGVVTHAHFEAGVRVGIGGLTLCGPCYDQTCGLWMDGGEPDLGAQLADLGAQFVTDFAEPVTITGQGEVDAVEHDLTPAPEAPADPKTRCACAVCGKVTARTQAGTPRKHQPANSASKSICSGSDLPGLGLVAVGPVVEQVEQVEPVEPVQDFDQAMDDLNSIPF
jgi:hypothetical protein